MKTKDKIINTSIRLFAEQSAEAAGGILEQANMLSKLVKQFRLLEQREECQV